MAAVLAASALIARRRIKRVAGIGSVPMGIGAVAVGLQTKPAIANVPEIRLQPTENLLPELSETAKAAIQAAEAKRLRRAAKRLKGKQSDE